MRFEITEIPRVVVVKLERFDDERGFFARAYCEREFSDLLSGQRVVQCNLSGNRKRGTLRGLHLQAPPSREGKLVRCIRGRIWDVALDLRPRSPTYLRHVGITLDAVMHDALYVPPGVAHGFQALEDDSELLYLMTDFHAPDLAMAVRWDDPAFAIPWPIENPSLNDRDRTLPDFSAAAHRSRVGDASDWGP